MSINTKLHLNNAKYDIHDVYEVLKSCPLIQNITPLKSESPGYYTLNFVFKANNKQMRSLSMFTNNEIAGFPCLTLDLGADPQSNDLFETIGKRLGGIYLSNDCNNESIIFQDQVKSNFEYLLKKAQLHGSADSLEMINHFIKNRL